jgi:hypothetical protein
MTGSKPIANTRTSLQCISHSRNRQRNRILQMLHDSLAVNSLETTRKHLCSLPRIQPLATIPAHRACPCSLLSTMGGRQHHTLRHPRMLLTV